MIALPPSLPLISRCRALAALDLILSPEWDGRYYSFNAHWSEGEMMTSMRNGSGDEWWIVFHCDGWAALKGLDHESPAWSRHGEQLSKALQSSLPKELQAFSTEPAFRWDETSFAYFQLDRESGWIRANDLTKFGREEAGDGALLAHVVGDTRDYASFAEDYYETEIDEKIVAAIFALQPITSAMVRALNPSTSLEDIASELYDEIGYPRPSA